MGEIFKTACTHVAIVDVEDVDLSGWLDFLHSGSVPAAKKWSWVKHDEEEEVLKIDRKNNRKSEPLSVYFPEEKVKVLLKLLLQKKTQLGLQNCTEASLQ